MQWVRILASGDPVRGMALVFIQKLCTAFHELDPAWREGALNERRLDFFRGRLAGRIRKVLATLTDNGLGTVKGVGDMVEPLRAVEMAQAMDELAALTERVHAANHVLCDGLERL